MTKAVNADASLQRFRNAKQNYDQNVRPLLENIRTTYASQAPDVAKQSAVDDDASLEAHLRVFVINELLGALNWTPGENLAPETPLSSYNRNTTRFLDYLGFERDHCEAPLLIVEAKRPSSDLPKPTARSANFETYAEVVSYGLKGNKLSGDWPKWLKDLKDYVQSATRRSRCPRRAVITNGRWIVVFENPQDAFEEGGSCLHESIHVFEESDFEAKFPRLYRLLEYSHVSGHFVPVDVASVSMYMAVDAATMMMHGLRVMYIETPSHFEGLSPGIKVVPLLFIGSSAGTWLCVWSRKELELPQETDKLSEHLREVDAAAKTLADSVSSLLGRTLPLRSLREHYGAELGSLRGVREVARNLYEVVTGTSTHYLHSIDSAPSCRWHEWGNAKADGVQDGQHPIVSRSTQPRSFFFSPETHHCAHSAVSGLKKAELTPLNRPACGARSGEYGQAFCEIIRFDERLCCRTCAFEEVCTTASAFRLPCVR